MSQRVGVLKKARILTRRAIATAQLEFDSVITQAVIDGHSPQSVQSFLLEAFDSSAAGAFRLRVKIHKSPMGASYEHVKVLGEKHCFVPCCRAASCVGNCFECGAIQLMLCG